MRIFPMPKINFHIDLLYAVCNPFSFEYNGYDEAIHISPISKQIVTGSINHTQFEQAVQEWLQNWVKENFEGVLVPDRMESDDVYDEQEIFHNACLDQLLSLNPNAIVEDV